MSEVKHKGEIVNHSDNAIRFVEDGVQEEQVFQLASHIKPEYYRKGRAEVTMQNDVVTFISMEGAKKGTDKGTDNSGAWTDDMTNFKDLLNDAHEKLKERLSKMTGGVYVEKHWVRMAETRAIVRALRWATNNAAVAVEETEEADGGEDDTEDQSAP